jgi:diacylglycerol O-acyltransferase / wax synthase
MSMERLTEEDRFMLWPDEIWPQDIGALALLDGSRLIDSNGALRIDAVREAVASRLHLVPRFRQLLYIPPRRLGSPLWVDAPTIDLADHVAIFPVPAPGNEAQLLLAVEQLRRRRLDRSRPLWEMWFLTGLPEHRVGLFMRMHHAMADGMAALAAIESFLDTTPYVIPIPRNHGLRPGCPQSVTCFGTSDSGSDGNFVMRCRPSHTRWARSDIDWRRGRRCGNLSPIGRSRLPASTAS